MENVILEVRSVPPSKVDEEPDKGLVLSVVEQPKLLDELAKQQLITLSLAIPGPYATVLKFINGDAAVVCPVKLVAGAFVCWFLSMLLGLASLVPRKWKVDRTVLRRDEVAAKEQPLSIEEFFRTSATYKRNLLIVACLLCFTGICLAGLTIFFG